MPGERLDNGQRRPATRAAPRVRDLAAHLAQLHQGLEGSRLFLNYAAFGNTAAFAATNDQPGFGPLRKV